LIDGGVDILFPETGIDTLNLKACLFAIDEVFEERRIRLPVMISMTIPDASGANMSMQAPEAFWISVAHAQPLAVGINCALGVDEMRPHVEEFSRVCTTFTSCHPNAGLPNAFGEYDHTPEHMAKVLREFAANGWLNIVGGCCGTTPGHIHAIAQAVREFTPRVRPVLPDYTRLAGIEPLTIRPESNFTMIGERTNVTGSKRLRAEPISSTSTWTKRCSTARRQCTRFSI
jgi:5-methyltetrahydrofolate--homocysteine methyltransferase